MDGELFIGESGVDSAIGAMRVRWTGTRPILMHNERLANPADPISRKLAEYHSLKAAQKKLPENMEAVARLEFEGGLYFDEETGPYIPAHNILACIRDAAKITRRGTDVKRGVIVLGDAPLIYDGPRTIDEMWADGRFRDTRSVRLSGRVQRTRPMFPRGWQIEAEIRFSEEIIDRESLISVQREAGEYVGVGDYRERFGRFRVEVIG